MIHLLVPGLLGPFPRFAEAGEAPRLPALETLLARGERGPGGGSIAEVAFALFGVDADPAATAALCHAADAGGVEASRVLLHAHPVHLVPDQDRLLALDFHDHSLSAEETAAFVEAFNRHFVEDGLELLAPHPDRWYLAVEQEPRARFHPLADILGRNIDHFLPEGEQARYWRALLNEVQMLFHGLPVNAEREARGLWPVNGLWFSGAGRLPPVPGGWIGGMHAATTSTAPPPHAGEAGRGQSEGPTPTLPASGEGEGASTVSGNPLNPSSASGGGREEDGSSPVYGGGWEGETHALFTGLLRSARATGPDRLLLELSPGLAVLDGDFAAWCQALQRFDERLAPLLGESLTLYDASGQTWHWRPAMRRRFWRRPKRIVPAAH
ncbi:hypothetical protein [endosymbiont of unidentified scaly snail isolate Monju]|uniref:hypothetical protein n=1 Tax=endosymbiont of unidentified scaly snail isolate Monju TaxID=1248727 RepID=UPI0003891EE7|nr:hypothetical protein [endosymbiont of unidentified scaly snail isolate Monju]BAN69478.1 hypothetical protein EBS_1597 [endosymbiont of unidentified scaly snail isolate Monju]